jgi:hypothetical protein
LVQGDGEGGEHGGGWRAGGGDETIGATQRWGDKAKHGGADDAGHGAQGRIARSDGGIDGDTEGDRRGEHHQHGREATPEVPQVCLDFSCKGVSDHAIPSHGWM